jgi:hypothetical protein
VSGSMWSCSGRSWSRSAFQWLSFAGVIAVLGDATPPSSSAIEAARLANAAIFKVAASDAAQNNQAPVTFAVTVFELHAMSASTFGDN